MEYDKWKMINCLSERTPKFIIFHLSFLIFHLPFSICDWPEVRSLPDKPLQPLHVLIHQRAKYMTDHDVDFLHAGRGFVRHVQVVMNQGAEFSPVDARKACGNHADLSRSPGGKEDIRGIPAGGDRDRYIPALSKGLQLSH